MMLSDVTDCYHHELYVCITNDIFSLALTITDL